ncbi:MAG: LytTR family transcriptional regulator DNA-binding domain-containing protein [Hyphomonadaceae bacterium]|nr:LytTR family transcriptional regulator DNA-binding domain-containing protein [Hyphomonadaceae bacterium]
MRETTEKVREGPALAARASRIAARLAAENWPGVATAALAGVFMAFVGAFGMDDLTLGQRLAYWGPTMVVGSLFGAAIGRFVARPHRIGDRPWLIWAATSAVVSAPITVFVWWYTHVFFGSAGPDILSLFVNVLLIAGVMTAIMMLVYRPGATTLPAPANSAPASIRFLDRLPAKLKGAAIYAVSAEDHYLRLHTSKGSDLILMRLSDAIAELEGIEGAQTHRSWWVAREAVQSVRREGERLVLVLKGGAEAPVSRPNVKPLREAGWF